MLAFSNSNKCSRCLQMNNWLAGVHSWFSEKHDLVLPFSLLTNAVDGGSRLGSVYRWFSKNYDC